MVDVSIADPELGPEEKERVLDVLESGHLAAGEQVDEFEDEFAAFADANHGVATSNGTTALQAALEAVGIEPGHAVVTTPFSFVATANAIRFAGGIPVFADIDPNTYNIDPHSVEERIRAADEKVGAIVAVHLYGCPADMAHLADIADTYDIPLVEDAAQAHGAEVDGERVGAIGDVGTFSFYPTKNMTTGEGGMITTDRDDVAESAARFVNHGRETEGYEHVELGHNFRLTNMAAAIGRTQLQRLPEFNERRRENAQRLTDQLTGSELVTPTEPTDRRHVYHQYTVRCENRERRQTALENRGIDTAVYYPNPIHELEAYDAFGGNARRAEQAAEEVLSLPVHPNVTDEEIDAIAAGVTKTDNTV